VGHPPDTGADAAAASPVQGFVSRRDTPRGPLRHGSDQIGESVAEIGEHPVVETGARLGYAVNGVVHILIAVIALRMAWWHTGEDADQSGALQTVAGNPFGMVLLWVILIGYALLFLWQLTESVRPHGGETHLSGRVKGLAKSAVYAALALTAFRFATGGSSSSTQQTVDFTATLREAPFGPGLVAVVGLVVIGVGGHHVRTGSWRRFLGDLERHPGNLAVRAGQFGYAAKGVALAIVGALFLLAAQRHQASAATGLDGARHTLLRQPGGPYLVTAIAAGLIAVGVCSLARALHAAV
jgi:hypothetical protein